MIFDSIENARLYAGLSENLDEAFAFIGNTDFTNAEKETIEIDGQNAYAMVQPYTTAGTEGRLYEAHRRYIDLQYLASGFETMICRSVEGLEEEVPYDDENDATLYRLSGTGDADLPYRGGTEMRMRAGDFLVLFPQDAHVPMIASGEPRDVLKIVVKVRL